MKQLGRLLLTRLHKLKALTTHLGCIYRTAGVPKLKKPKDVLKTGPQPQSPNIKYIVVNETRAQYYPAEEGNVERERRAA